MGDVSDRIASQIRREDRSHRQPVFAVETQPPCRCSDEAARAAEQEDDDEPCTDTRHALDDGGRSGVPEGPSEQRGATGRRYGAE
jgi:hypothetical protein